MEINEQEQSNGTEKKKSSFLKGLSYFLTATVTLLLAGGGFYFYTQHEDNIRQQELDYAVLTKENYNLDDYSYFLEKYPNSEHYQEIKHRYAQLNAMANEWKLIAPSSNPNEFVDFKNKYHDPRYAHLCNQKIDSLDWCEAQKLHTPEAYQHYLNQHPDGMYIAEAIEGQNAVAYMNLSIQESKNVFIACQLLFSAIEEGNQEIVAERTAPVIEEFDGMSSPGIMEILNWGKNHLKGNTSVSYRVGTETQTEKKYSDETNFCYNTSFPLTLNATRDDGTEQTTRYKAVVKMTKDYRIYYLKLEKTSI